MTKEFKKRYRDPYAVGRAYAVWEWRRAKMRLRDKKKLKDIE